MADKFRYGGQAVMEGVMMRGQKTMATVVRRPNGTLAREVKPLSRIYTGSMRKTPFIRGGIAMLESMVLGISSLMYSANIALEEDGDDKKPEDTKKNDISGASVWLMMALSFALGIGLFFLAPLFLAKLLDPYIESSLLFHLVEGSIRLIIFLVYLRVVAFLPDIKRVFAYHGAEHKTIHAYEAGVELTPEAVTAYTTAHARCGTAFLLAVMVIAILVFAVIGKQVLWLMVLTRILLLPLIASLSYELTQFGARHLDNPVVKILIAPGLWLQSLTTRQPDTGQLEVAIAALKEVLAADGVIASAETPTAISSPQA
jgi:uncharacterized protein YqhQ